MTTKRIQEKLHGWQICASTGAPGLLSALQDDTEEVTFFSIFCDSIYCIKKPEDQWSCKRSPETRDIYQ